MLLTSLIIVAILLTSYILMSTDRLNHINRAALAMCTGVGVWVVLTVCGTKLNESSINHFIQKAVEVVLFITATTTILKIMNNNGVFDAVKGWLRTHSTMKLLWGLSLMTFVISANVDNFTTAVLMISLMSSIVSSNRQRLIYSCVILVSAQLGGSFTVIGDMTNLMLWLHKLITPTQFAAGLVLPALASLIVFNLLVGRLLVGRVEVSSTLGRGNDDVYLPAWQKILMLIVGFGSIWAVPSFSRFTDLPPFLGALTALALVLMLDGIYNFRRNGNQLFVNRKVLGANEYIVSRLSLYFIGITLGVGALNECGALHFIGDWLSDNVHNVYVYGGVIGILSSIIDNVPFVIVGMHFFQLDTIGVSPDFCLDGVYWQLISFCSAIGASLLCLGSLAGHAVAETEDIRIGWYFRNIFWRVLVAWAVGMVVFYFTH